MNHLMLSFTSFLTLWSRSVFDCVFRPHTAPLVLIFIQIAFQLVAFISTLPLGLRSLPSAEKAQVESEASPVDALHLFTSNPLELSLSLDNGATSKAIIKALSDLHDHFMLKSLELRAPDLALDEWQQMVAVHTLSRTLIHMSLLTHLSLSGNFVTEVLLTHISLLPRLEMLIISPSPAMNNLPGKKSAGFSSLRTLSIPNKNLLRRFLSYPFQGLETLSVGNLGRDSLSEIARGLPCL